MSLNLASVRIMYAEFNLYKLAYFMLIQKVTP